MSLFWPLGNKSSTQFDRNFLVRRLSKISAEKMLDTGSAICNVTKEVADAVEAQEVHAVDIGEFKEQCQQYDFRFKQADLNEALPYKDEAFDLVTSIHTIEHVIDTDQYLDEIHRVLKPVGKVLIETVNLAALHYRLMLLLGFQPNVLAPSRHKIHPFSGKHGKHPHKSVFTYKGLIEVTEKHGFELVKGRSHTIYPLPSFLATGICRVWPNVGLFTSLLLKKSP